MTRPVPDCTLDTSGLLCPEPVMLLHNRIRDMRPGECVEVLATDPSTQRDIPRFCQFLEHELLAEEAGEGRFRYWIRKGAVGKATTDAGPPASG